MLMKKVGPVAHAADDHAGAVLPAELDGQPVPRGGRDVVPVRGKLPAQPDRPFRRGAGRLLIAIDGHEHVDPREKLPCPLYDVEMAGRDGSEEARLDRIIPMPHIAGYLSL